MNELELQIDRYLSGELSRVETLAFERELTDPRLGEAFREVLLIRELVQSAPPHGVPDGLNERITRALRTEMSGSASVFQDPETATARHTRIARDGLSWMLRGPAMALAGLPRETMEQPTRSEGRGAALARATGGWLLRRMRGRP